MRREGSRGGHYEGRTVERYWRAASLLMAGESMAAVAKAAGYRDPGILRAFLRVGPKNGLPESRRKADEAFRRAYRLPAISYFPDLD